LDRGPRTLELGNGAPGRMFDASLERLSVTETSYNNSLAERVTRSTIQTLPATLPEPWSKARGPRSVEKTAGARAAIGDSPSELITFCMLALGGPSRTAGLGLGFWETARGSGVWMMRFRQFLFWRRSMSDCYNQIE